MTAIILYRIDATKRMHRFYRLDVQPDLFGQWFLTREWGRIGSPGRMCVVSFATAPQAAAALGQLRRIKERRGYAAA